MDFKPVKKRKRVFEEVIHQIEHAVKTGQIKPGDKLPSERQLAEMMDVSRTSVKEAVTVLETSGIIMVRPGVGMYLNANSKNELMGRFANLFDEQYDFVNLIELRQAVEGDAAYYAASRISDEQKVNLTNIFNTLLKAEQDGKDGIQEDFRFHYAIIEAANNPVMLSVMNLVSDKIIENLKASRNYSIQSDLLNKDVMQEHEKIFRAIVNNQPDLAKEAMWEHHQAIKHRYLQAAMKEGD